MCTDVAIYINTTDRHEGVVHVCVCVCLVAQSCLTLCDPMDCSPPGSSVHGILQARIPEWVAIAFPRGSSGPRDQTQVSHVAGRLLTVWGTGEARCEHLCFQLCHMIPRAVGLLAEFSFFLCFGDPVFELHPPSVSTQRHCWGKFMSYLSCLNVLSYCFLP